MKKNTYIIIVLSLIVIFSIWIFSYNSYNDKIKQKNIVLEQQKLEEQRLEDIKLEEEILDKLEDLEINPLIPIEWVKEDIAISEKIVIKNDNNAENIISEQDLVKKESISILTFSTIEQCKTLKFLIKKCEDKFLYSLATDEWNIRYCNKLNNKSDINNCKDDINYKNNNCSLIINKYLKSKCEYNNKELKEIQSKQLIISNSNNSSDTSKCSLLDTYYDKESCIKNIILDTNNIDLCLSFFKNSDEQVSCYKNISYDFNRDIINEAYTKKDLSICDSIKIETIKNQCKSMKF